MKVTIDDNFLISIEDMEPEEVKAFISMVRGAGLDERRIFHPVLKQLTETPFDQLERKPKVVTKVFPLVVDEDLKRIPPISWRDIETLAPERE